jgi:hypothetical protein
MQPEEPCEPFTTDLTTIEEDGTMTDHQTVLMCRCMAAGHELPYPHEGMSAA